MAASEYFQDGGRDQGTRMFGATERSDVEKGEEREWKRRWGSEGGRLGSGSGGVCANSGSESGERMSQTGLCGHFVVILGEMKCSHRRDDRLLNAHLLLKARNKTLVMRASKEGRTSAVAALFTS